MTANGQAVAVSPADQIRDRLDDPTVAASLNALLDHADLLAVLVTGLDGFVRRGDLITDSLTSAVNDFKGVSVAGVLPGAEALKGVDVQGVDTNPCDAVEFARRCGACPQYSAAPGGAGGRRGQGGRGRRPPRRTKGPIRALEGDQGP